MDTVTIASRLNMSPKALRRKLRTIGTFQKVDGQYFFSEEDYRKLMEQLSPEPSNLVERHDLNTDEAMSTEKLKNYWTDPQARAEARRKSAHRRRKLLLAIAQAS